MAGPFAMVQDVEARWHSLSALEEITAAVLIDDASALLRAEFPGIDAQIKSGAIDPGILVIVVSNMVKRAMLAPADGISQSSETVGPYSHGQSYANPLGNVFLTTAERTLILGRQPLGMSVRYG